jgi:hypothetical protein
MGSCSTPLNPAHAGFLGGLRTTAGGGIVFPLISQAIQPAQGGGRLLAVGAQNP